MNSLITSINLFISFNETIFPHLYLSKSNQGVVLLITGIHPANNDSLITCPKFSPNVGNKKTS